MSDIELVIKIPEDIMEYIKNNGCLSVIYNNEVAKAITNGTPLPKGHGRLIDADKATREENSKLVNFDISNTRDKSYCKYAKIILNGAPTIIEADKTEL